MGAGKSLAKLFKTLDEAKKFLGGIDTVEKAVSLSGKEREMYLRALDKVHGPKEARAAGMGFADRDFYHGTTANFDAFDKSKGNSSGFAGFVATDPSFANGYADMARSSDKASQVLPLRIKTNNYFDPSTGEGKKVAREILDEQFSYVKNPETKKSIIDRQMTDLANPKENWHVVEDSRFSELLKKRGYDTAFIREKGAENLAVMEPNQIRSKFAAFDPRFKDSAKIMAGGAGAMIGVNALGDNQAQAAVEEFNPVGLAKSANDWFSKNVAEKISAPVKAQLTPDLNVRGQTYPTSSAVTDFAIDAGTDPRSWVAGPLGDALGASEFLGEMAPDRGETKWAKSGLQKMNSSGGYTFDESALSNPKAKQILMMASDYEPDSRAMNHLKAQLQNEMKKGNK